MVRIEGLISRRVIRAWLENYQALEAQDVEIDAIPSNAGAKSYDGVSGKQLNFIMLQAAIRDLPPDVRRCVIARWVALHGLGETLRQLGLTKDVYYKRCDQAINLIYYALNGLAVNYAKLVVEIKMGLDKGAELGVK